MTVDATMEAEAAASTEATAPEVTEEPVVEDILMGNAEITEEQLTQLRDGMMYINVHTEMHPDGEIRGQVMEGEADMEAMEAMMGAMEGDAAGLQLNPPGPAPPAGA
jgi:hypothetical protein